MGAVLSNAVDLQPTKFLHQVRHVAVDDEQRFLGEAVEVNAQAAERFQHAVQHGLVGVLKRAEHGFVAVFTGVDKGADGLLDVFSRWVVLSAQLSGLVPANPLMVGFVRPLGVCRISVGEQGFDLLGGHVVQRPCQDGDLFAHVVHVILCGDGVAPQSVKANQRVPEDGVSSPPHVEGAVGVRGGVFNQDFTSLIVCGSMPSFQELLRQPCR